MLSSPSPFPISRAEHYCRSYDSTRSEADEKLTRAEEDGAARVPKDQKIPHREKRDLVGQRLPTEYIEVVWKQGVADAIFQALKELVRRSIKEGEVSPLLCYSFTATTSFPHSQPLTSVQWLPTRRRMAVWNRWTTTRNRHLVPRHPRPRMRSRRRRRI